MYRPMRVVYVLHLLGVTQCVWSPTVMVSIISIRIELTFLLWILSTVERSDGGTSSVLHMMGFMKNRASNSEATFEISVLNPGVGNANVCLSTQDGRTRNVTIRSKGFHTESFNSEYEVIKTTLSRQGIQVTSDQDLLVYGSSHSYNGLGGFLSVPIKYQGYLYSVVTGGLNGQILVAGVYPNTCVQITLRLTNNEVIYDHTPYGNGSAITEILQEYDTMQIKSAEDLTGTEIRSSEAISVFGGSRGDGVYRKQDHYLEQLPPLKHWAKKYVTVPPYGKEYHCKILSGFVNTVVNYTCSERTTKSLDLHDVGSFATLEFHNWACLLISNEPILVTIIASTDNKNPAMITMPPMKEVAEELMVFVSGMVTSAQIVLITETDITIYPTAASSSTYVECPEHLHSCITYITDLVANQTFTISSADKPFTITGFVYGVMGKKTSMGYPIVHHTSQQEVDNVRQSANVTCESSTHSSTRLPGTSVGSFSTNGPDLTTNLNKVCRLCCTFKNYSQEEIEAMIQQLRDELLIEPNTTSMYLRSLTSAPDTRASSKAIGYTTGVILGTLFTCLIVADLGNLIKMFHRIRENLCFRPR